VESRAIFLRDKEKQKLEREMDGYMNWICRAGEFALLARDDECGACRRKGSSRLDGVRPCTRRRLFLR